MNLPLPFLSDVVNDLQSFPISIKSISINLYFLIYDIRSFRQCIRDSSHYSWTKSTKCCQLFGCIIGCCWFIGGMSCDAIGRCVWGKINCKKLPKFIDKFHWNLDYDSLDKSWMDFGTRIVRHLDIVRCALLHCIDFTFGRDCGGSVSENLIFFWKSEASIFHSIIGLRINMLWKDENLIEDKMQIIILHGRK